MNKPVFYIIFLFCFFKLDAQENLVPNGSFEDTIFCPQTTVTPGSAIGAQNWLIPTGGTPDYFNICSSEYMGIPENILGYQEAKHGVAYAGLLTYYVFENTREYLGVKLTKPLISGQRYYWCFWASLADSLVDFASNNLGIALSENYISNSTEELLNVEVYGFTNQVITDNINWTLLSGSFVAKGNENYLYIGNFFPDHQTSIIQVKEEILFGSSAYYFIDNIYLGESVCELEIFLPNVFTPNNDGSNDIYSINSNFSDVEYRIFNRWGETIFFGKITENWDGTFQGKNCVDGVYFIQILLFENLIKTGYIHLVR